MDKEKQKPSKGETEILHSTQVSPHSQSVMARQLKRPPDTFMWREMDGWGDLQDSKAHLELLPSLTSVSPSLGHSVQAGRAPCCCVNWAEHKEGVRGNLALNHFWERQRQPQAGSTEVAQAGRSKATDGVCTMTQSQAGTSGQWQQPMCSLHPSSWPEMGSAYRKNNSFLL